MFKNRVEGEFFWPKSNSPLEKQDRFLKILTFLKKGTLKTR
jgi:hypothetical protein